MMIAMRPLTFVVGASYVTGTAAMEKTKSSVSDTQEKKSSDSDTQEQQVSEDNVVNQQQNQDSPGSEDPDEVKQDAQQSQAGANIEEQVKEYVGDLIGRAQAAANASSVGEQEISQMIPSRLRFQLDNFYKDGNHGLNIVTMDRIAEFLGIDMYDKQDLMEQLRPSGRDFFKKCVENTNHQDDADKVLVERMFGKDYKTISLLDAFGRGEVVGDRAELVRRLLRERPEADLTVRSNPLDLISPLETPLHLAAKHGHTAVISELKLHLRDRLQQPATFRELLHAKDCRGDTPLHYASYGDAAVVKALLDDLDADAVRKLVFEKDNHGMTPLHSAARNGNVEVAEALLDSLDATEVRKLVFEKDDNGRTPLHEAALEDMWQGEHVAVAEALLATLDAAAKDQLLVKEDKYGKTPSDLVWSCPRLRQLLDKSQKR